MQLVKRMSGLIVLTKYVAEDIVNERIPYMVMEGAVSLDHLNDFNSPNPEQKALNQHEKIIMYTGALTGLELLLDAFALIRDESYRLWICGRGEMEGQLKAASAKDKRIVYWGILSNEELFQKKLKATVLVNVRSSRTPFIQYSFPSKLLEYMITGRPVVSTVLPGIPNEYKEYLYMLDRETPEELMKLLQYICVKSSQELNSIGQRAKDFVIKNKNYKHQGKRISDFIESL
jgi:glycosyltransferase involved in cell wall biosynthesis